MKKKKSLLDDMLNEPTQADISKTIDKNESDIGKDLLGGKVIVGGLSMRPLSMASIAMMKQINSPLLAGADLNAIPSLFLDVVTLIVLQTLPLAESSRLVLSDRDGLTTKAYELMETIHPSKIEELLTQVITHFRDSTATQVNAKKPSRYENDNDDDELGKATRHLG